MIWDLYNKNFNKTGEIINENNLDDIPDGLYHLTVNVWIVNSNKEILLIKKALNYDLRYPGCWTNINGNVISGDDSYNTIRKSIYEKIGINLLDTDEIVELGQDVRNPHHYIYKTFIVYKNLNIESLVLNENYYSKVKWVDVNELENMMLNGEIEFSLIDRIEKYILPLLKSKN